MASQANITADAVSLIRHVGRPARVTGHSFGCAIAIAAIDALRDSNLFPTHLSLLCPFTTGTDAVINVLSGFSLGRQCLKTSLLPFACWLTCPMHSWNSRRRLKRWKTDPSFSKLKVLFVSAVHDRYVASSQHEELCEMLTGTPIQSGRSLAQNGSLTETQARILSSFDKRIQFLQVLGPGPSFKSRDEMILPHKLQDGKGNSLLWHDTILVDRSGTIIPGKTVKKVFGQFMLGCQA